MQEKQGINEEALANRIMETEDFSKEEKAFLRALLVHYQIFSFLHEE